MAYVKLMCNTFRPDPKKEKVYKEPKVLDKTKKPTGEAAVFAEIWKERKHKSQIGGANLKDARAGNFLHVLPKAQNKYPEYKLLKQNIVLGTEEEHFIWDNARHLAVGKQWNYIIALEALLKSKYKLEYGKH